MTPEIHDRYKQIQAVLEMLAPTLAVAEMIGLEKFEDDARPYANGTMSVIMPHFMSIQDMQKSEKNLKHAIEVSRTIRKLTTLITTERPQS